MKLAIIDCGVNTNYIPAQEIERNVYVSNIGLIRPREIGNQPKFLHGTIVAGIIKKYAPKVDIYSIDVFPFANLRTTNQVLLVALRWCKKMNIPLINMSVGTTEDSDFKSLSNMIEKLYNNDQIIVAAAHNDGNYTLPAMHKKTIGVRCDPSLWGYSFRKLWYDDLDYVASGMHSITFQSNTISISTKGSNSTAVPTITAAIANGDIKLW